MNRHEQDFVDRMERSPSDRAEVLVELAMANLERAQFVGVGAVLHEVAFAAWCVALDESGAEQLAAAAREGLRRLDSYSHCAVERTVLRVVAEQADVEAQLEVVPDDAHVTGSGCLAAHMVDLGAEGSEL